ncbi:MAG: 4'-phosphopantetheinyl transferase superfamily protein [Spirosomataceae bacterium]
MPLIFCELLDNECFIGLWEVTESHSFFLERLPLDENMADELQEILHPQKQLEWLASRYLVELVTAEAGVMHRGIAKDEFGKPFLEDTPVQISITHTLRYVAVALHPRLPLGIDMEKPSPKLARVATKFCMENELADAQQNLKKLCIYWSAKEALYKLYGRKRLTFRENLQIVPFHESATRITGYIKIDGSEQVYSLQLKWMDEYVLVIAY